jgi:hypothetical protein
MARGKVKPDAECKLFAIRVRLTEDERKALDKLAAAQGLTVSDLTRQRLDLGALLASETAGVQAFAMR